MKIKFNKHDPRAGMIAEVEADRAKDLIDAGSAAEVSGGEAGEEEKEAVQPPVVATKKASKKAR